jgi:hypothetical protein
MDAERDKEMTLTNVEQERISDSRLKLQSVAESLHHIDRAKVPDLGEVEDCLDEAEKTLTGALAASEKK